jgi:hypothetical protein
MNQNGSCLLCGKSAKLIKKSHVIPSFMYQGLFDEKNRMILYPLENKNEKAYYVQSGFHDKYLYCSKCDNELFGRLERNAASVLYGSNASSKHKIERAISNDGIRSLFIKDIDYVKFKLFILSILWKAHNSPNKFYEKVEVGEQAGVIRQMLLTNNPGTDDQYRISIVGIQRINGEMANMLPNPEVRKSERLHIATFYIGGFIYLINLGEVETEFQLFRTHYLGSQGDIEIPLLNGVIGNQFLKAIGVPDEVADYFVK